MILKDNVKGTVPTIYQTNKFDDKTQNIQLQISKLDFSAVYKHNFNNKAGLASTITLITM